MDDQFTVVTTVIIYNNQGKYLVVKRSATEDQNPNVFSYVGGKLDYQDFDHSMELLERNAQKEFQEEVGLKISNLQYLGSDGFEKENGAKAVLICFLAHSYEGEIKVDVNEVAEVHWFSFQEIQDLPTMLPPVKNYYKLAHEQLQQKEELHHLDVAGIVVDPQGRFLVIRNYDAQTKKLGQYTYPVTRVKPYQGSTWEVLEKNLAQAIFTQTAIEIADGPIPFTDQSMLSKDRFDRITQFFIAKYKFGTPTITKPELIGEVSWKKLAELNSANCEPLVIDIFSKAVSFISALSS